MINFNFEVKKENLTFGNVRENEFFVDKCGYLCQKTHSNSYSVIALSDGTPEGNHYNNVDENESIERIIGLPTKIEF